jgi:hypothetical protein
MSHTAELLSATHEHALLSNRVVSALVMEEVTEAEERREALAEAVLFLNNIIDAKDLNRSLALTDEAYRSALAYSDGMKVLDVRTSRKGKNAPDTEKEVKHLLSTALALTKHAKVVADDRQRLIAFFRQVRNLTLQGNEKTIERVCF